MTFRSRILVSALAIAVIPLVAFGLGVRRAVADRVTAEYRERVAALVAQIRRDLDAESAAIGMRLAALAAAAREDNRFRLAAQGVAAERPWLLDYAGQAMSLAGLAMLQFQDDSGRIVSSGHFRNEFDRLEPGLPRALAAAPGGLAIVPARSAAGPFLAFARVDSLRIGRRAITIVGGTAVGPLLARLARDGALTVSLEHPGGAVPAGDTAQGTVEIVGALEMPYIDDGGGGTGDGGRVMPARLVVRHSLASLAALRRAVDAWFAIAVMASAAVTLLLAGWLSTRLSRPLAALARKTAEIDVDRLDVTFESERDDEIGALARLLGGMTERLRAGAARLREVERRAALGDLARQVNHDIKNALAPIRNVVRHLADVARARPGELAAVFGERQGTVDSSIAYLESLASNYARLSPRLERRPCDVNAVVRDTLRNLAAGKVEVTARLAESVPAACTDPLVLRRVVENLVGNAIDALDGKPGAVTVSTERTDGDDAPGVRLTVADTGRGMSKTELDRAFDDFYTTKPGGTGLGLTIVRRLVLDSNGRLRVETAPGAGSGFIVELPGDPGGAA